jgi:hypothetical protein
MGTPKLRKAAAHLHMHNRQAKCGNHAVEHHNLLLLDGVDQSAAPL